MWYSGANYLSNIIWVSEFHVFNLQLTIYNPQLTGWGDQNSDTNK